MKIREVTKKDREQIYKLALEQNKIMQRFISFPVYKINFTKKVFDKLFIFSLKKNHFFYGIEIDNKIVAIISGFIQKAPQGRIGYLSNIMVSKKYQSKGYARILRDEFFKWLKQKRVCYCKLGVLAKNSSAIKIYEKWGFKVNGLEMTKRI